MFKTKRNYIFLLLSLLTVPQLSQSMQPTQPVGQLEAMQTFAQEIRQRLVTRFGPYMAEFVFQVAARYMTIKDKYFPAKTQIKPKQFDPVKYLAVGTFKFINRNKISIGLTSSTLLTILMFYMVGKTWYERTQERDGLYSKMLRTLESDRTATAISNAYNNFPEHIKNTKLKEKIDAYELAIKEYQTTGNQQNLQKFSNAFSQLWLALYD